MSSLVVHPSQDDAGWFDLLTAGGLFLSWTGLSLFHRHEQTEGENVHLCSRTVRDPGHEIYSRGTALAQASNCREYLS